MKADTLYQIDREIHEGFNLTMMKPFNLEAAHIYGVEVFPGERPMMIPVAEHPDIYTMLDSSSVAEDISPYTMFAIVTTGWAAPIEDVADVEDGLPPSKHPKRRRVRVLMLVDQETDQIMSSLRFGDSDDVIYNEEREGAGSLMDAVESLMRTAKKHKRGRNLND